MNRQTCPDCKCPNNRCICHTIVKLQNHWPVHILQHKNEKHHAIGTAKIAQLSLSQCTTYNDNIGGNHEQIIQSLLHLKPILIFPTDTNAKEELDLSIPRPLIFLDATWRKAKRMYFESELLHTLPAITISPSNSSAYIIRKSPDENALSTIEAIAQTLGHFENNNTKYQPLLESMDWMIKRQIELMGKDTYQKNYLNNVGSKT